MHYKHQLYCTLIDITLLRQVMYMYSLAALNAIFMFQYVMLKCWCNTGYKKKVKIPANTSSL